MYYGTGIYAVGTKL
ncbi:hypothetical protein QTO70_000400 [Klebsiella oxytoca]|nr:hypothetical protein [Klebsiella oxytoca]MDN4989193.1 hypothetical protein [Klebsiella oxytoca]